MNSQDEENPIAGILRRARQNPSAGTRGSNRHSILIEEDLLFPPTGNHDSTNGTANQEFDVMVRVQPDGALNDSSNIGNIGNIGLIQLTEGSRKRLTKKDIDNSTIAFDFKPAKRARVTRSQTLAGLPEAPPSPSPSTSNEVSLRDVDSGGYCVICFEKFVSNAKLRRLPCLHMFHAKCIGNWFKKSSKCPICRISIKVNYAELNNALKSGEDVEQWLRDQEARAAEEAEMRVNVQLLLTVAGRYTPHEHIRTLNRRSTMSI